MPNIPIVDAGNVALHPNETGIEATAGAARRVGAFYNQGANAEEKLARETERLGAQTAELGTFKGNLIAQTGSRVGSAMQAAGDAADMVVTNRQKSQGGAAYAGILRSKTDEWNKLSNSADVGDPTIAQGFMANLEPVLKQFQDSFTTEEGQKFAEAHVDALRTHFTEKTSADMSTRAGLDAVTKIKQTVNSLSANAHDDPSSMNFALASLKSLIEGTISSSPNLTAVEGSRVRSEALQNGSEAIVKSAAVGYITRTGHVPDWIRDPQFAQYVNGAELKVFEKQAQVQQRSDALMSNQARSLQIQLDDNAAHVAATKNYNDNVSVDPNDPRKLLIKPGFTQATLDIGHKYPNAPNAVQVMDTNIRWAHEQEREGHENVVDDPVVKSNLMTRFPDPQQPLTKLDVLEAEANGKLSNHTGGILKDMIEERNKGPSDPVFKTKIDAAKERVGETLVADGHERFSNFMVTFWPEYMRARNAGTLPPNALDLQDPNSMISKALKPWEPTASQRMFAHTFRSLGGVGPADLSGVPKEGGALTPNAVPTTTITLPPVKDRKKDQSYDTPSGKKKWTGTGWVNP